MSPVVEVQSLNHWTAKEALSLRSFLRNTTVPKAFSLGDSDLIGLGWGPSIIFFKALLMVLMCSQG